MRFNLDSYHSQVDSYEKHLRVIFEVLQITSRFTSETVHIPFILDSNDSDTF